MTGGLMQLVGKGAQDQLVTGNPSFTHFRSVYKRHTDFAMEHFELYFKTTNLNLPQSGSLTLRTKVERYAQLVHDCYLTLSLPNIYSPVVPIDRDDYPNLPRMSSSSDAIGYEFQWIHNIGYNMIKHVSVLINGQEIVRHSGEWMKLHAATKFDGNKKAILDQMVGNIREAYDPANAFDRMNQYPHSISQTSTIAEPSIAGRTLTIPLHFWFCESVGMALPLIALQQSEVEIVVELRNIYELFTVIDIQPTSPTFGTRISPDSSKTVFSMPHFLSPPLLDPTQQVNTSLYTWKLNPFIEANYIFVSDAELIHIAKTDHSFKITQIDMKETYGQYGPSNDLELTTRNLCTRIVWLAQRSDRSLLNDYDNYTNWENPSKPPLDSSGMLYMTPWYSSGGEEPSNVTQRDILLESNIILDGKDRFSTKTTDFFSKLQNFKHHTGRTTDLPGIYTYSFALEHNSDQPSGHINGSMFNKTILRNTYVQPPLSVSPSTSGTVVCVLKSTAGSANPTIVNPNAIGTNGKRLYSPEELVTIVRKTDAQTLQYSYNVRAYVESYNFLRVLGGIANVVFSS